VIAGVAGEGSAEGEFMTQATAAAFKSPLHKMTQTTPTCLWNDSAINSGIDVLDGNIGVKSGRRVPVIVLGD